MSDKAIIAQQAEESKEIFPAEVLSQIQAILKYQEHFESKYKNLMGYRESTLRLSAMMMYALYTQSPGNIRFYVHTKHNRQKSHNFDIFVPDLLAETKEDIEKYAINEAAENIWELINANKTDGKASIGTTCIITGYSGKGRTSVNYKGTVVEGNMITVSLKLAI